MRLFVCRCFSDDATSTVSSTFFFLQITVAIFDCKNFGKKKHFLISPFFRYKIPYNVSLYFFLWLPFKPDEYFHFSRVFRLRGINIRKSFSPKTDFSVLETIRELRGLAGGGLRGRTIRSIRLFVFSNALVSLQSLIPNSHYSRMRRLLSSLHFNCFTISNWTREI